MRITVLGLGEAGGRYASDLAAAGHTVTGYDPVATSAPEGVERATRFAQALADAELVIVLTPSSISEKLARDGRPLMVDDAVWADFTSASPQLMAQVAQLFDGAGPRFADVAVLGPVPFKGARTDLITSGPGAAVIAEVFAPLGASVEVLDSPAGDATARKLLRSVVMKSFASVVGEAVAAGRAAGCEDWIREQLAAQLAQGEVIIDRFLTGSRQHALRRAHEMRSTVEYLESLGVPADMSAASERTLLRLADENEASLVG